MRNERGAGRKQTISEFELDLIADRVSNGETIIEIAEEYSVSRQALYKRLKAYRSYRPIKISYNVNSEHTSDILIEPTREKVSVNNWGNRISTYAFGINREPSWDELGVFLENQLFKSGLHTERTYIFQDCARNSFAIDEIIDKSDSLELEDEDGEVVNSARSYYADLSVSPPRFMFSRKDILITRTSTDGYQLKALSKDRKWFVKSQAIMGETILNDWAVEIIASHVCNQLGISCVEQKYCEFIYDEHTFSAVCSLNFELDGYSFESFESLLERNGCSSNDKEFIHLDAVGKIEWCAEKLSLYGSIPFELTHKYMLDLAVIDCLVGNVDRHTRNFGLFFNVYKSCYEIPLIFDNGMGLFEHDYYRDRYTDYASAMRNVYVSPYGEDPFDMIDILNEKYNLIEIYPKMREVDYMETDRLWSSLTENAHTYINLMKEKLRELKCPKID